MKFTAIAKAIFVLGILTTSVMITENQSVNAKGKYEKNEPFIWYKQVTSILFRT